MNRLLYAEAVQEADRAAMASGIPSLVLMERAALSVVHYVEHHKDLYDTARVLVVCGPGNNGGDGAAIVRILRERGVKARLLFAGDRAKRTDQMKTQMDILERTQPDCMLDAACCTEQELDVLFRHATLLVDALFGIGLRRKVEGLFAEMIRRMNVSPAPVIAADMPSGVHTDTGEICGTAVQADATVTFTCGKPGLYLFPGAACAGRVVVRAVGIAMPEETDIPSGQEVRMLSDGDLADLQKRDESGNKGTFGKLLLIAGSAQISGAAYLAASAALRSGAGMVRIYTEETNRQILGTLLPEALITTWNGRRWSPDDLRAAMDWADGTVAGPGLGTDETALQILQTFLKENTKPAVLDADALNLIAAMRDVPRVTFPCTITPHVGEMSRLTGISPADIKAHIVSVAANAASEAGVYVLLKDARSVTACPDGRCYLNTSGSSALATAGSGDVLAGITGALMLRGDLPAPAAAVAAWIHGRCGEAAAEKRSRGSVIASDITEEIGRFL